MLLYRFVWCLLAQVPRWCLLLGKASIFRVFYPVLNCRFYHLFDIGRQDAALGKEGETARDFVVSRVDLCHSVHNGDVDEVDWVWSVGLLHRILDNPRFHHCCHFVDWHWRLGFRRSFVTLIANVACFASIACHFAMGVNESRGECTHSLYSCHWQRHYGVSIILACVWYYGRSILCRQILFLRLHKQSLGGP